MQEITQYRADDGTIFSDKTRCERHESLRDKGKALEALLVPRPKDDGCRFVNGHGYIQQKREDFLVFRRAILRLANAELPHKWFDHSLADPSAHPEGAYRLISECVPALERSWYRVLCTDSQFREWGQPYFRDNQSQIRQEDFFQINK